LDAGQPSDRVRLGSQRTIDVSEEDRDAVDEELLVRIPGRGAFPKDWSADGRLLTPGSTAGRAWRASGRSLVGDRTPFPLGRSGVRKQPRLSHDGRLIAFESDESGATEIYVAPFGKTGRRRVSTVAERSHGGGPMAGRSSSRP
jgi:hypothetical protein